jgi:glycosyltransferase involved in cell wall biosynthesis
VNEPSKITGLKILLAANTDWYLHNFRSALASYLLEQGCQVTLVSPPGQYAEQFASKGLRWIPWELGRQSLAPWQEIGSLRQIYTIYRQEKPDLVHHHTIKPVIYGTLAARVAGVPAMVNSITGRGYIFLDGERKARSLKRLVKPLYRLALNTPRCGVIFENEEDRQYFIANHLIPAKRTWLVEGVGVDPGKFSPQPEPPGEPVILLAARMLWDKGIGVLVEAARLLKADIPARVALVGEPDPGNPASVSQATLQSWHAEGIVEWWGWRTDMPAAYNQSHIVTLPTRYGEGVPTSLIEAAACGRPLVASDISGCRHVVREGENGFLVPPDDPPALAAALKRLVCDAALRGRMGAASRKLVMDKFTHAQVNATTLQIYQQVLGAEIL